MTSGIILLGLIYFLSLFFWSGYLYRHSLRTKDQRACTFRKIAEMFIYIPLGIQAAFLLWFAVFEFIPISNNLSKLFDRIILNNREQEYPGMYALKIIATGSLIIGLSMAGIKASGSLEDKVSKLSLRTILFVANLFLLKATVQNIYLSLHIKPGGIVQVNYENDYLWLSGVLLTIILSVLKNEEPGRDSFSKYAGLALGLILLYSFIALVVILPRIIYLIADKL